MEEEWRRRSVSMEKGEPSGGEREETAEEGPPEMVSGEEEERQSKEGSTKEEGEEKRKGYEGVKEIEEDEEEPVAGRGEEEEPGETSGEEERKEDPRDGGEAAGTPWKEENHGEGKEVHGEGIVGGEIGGNKVEDAPEEEMPKEETPEKGSQELKPQRMEAESWAKGGHKGEEVIKARGSGVGANSWLRSKAEPPEPSSERTTVVVVARNGVRNPRIWGNLPSKLSQMAGSRVWGDLVEKQPAEPTPKLVLEAVGEITRTVELTREAGGSQK